MPRSGFIWSTHSPPRAVPARSPHSDLRLRLRSSYGAARKVIFNSGHSFGKPAVVRLYKLLYSPPRAVPARSPYSDLRLRLRSSYGAARKVIFNPGHSFGKPMMPGFISYSIPHREQFLLAPHTRTSACGCGPRMGRHTRSRPALGAHKWHLGLALTLYAWGIKKYRLFFDNRPKAVFNKKTGILIKTR